MYVLPDPSDSYAPCFWIQLWRPLDPSNVPNELLWQSQLCIAPGQTYRYIIFIITEYVETSQGDFFGWTCEINVHCPIYYEQNVPDHQLRYRWLPDLPNLGDIEMIGLINSDVWSVGVEIEVEPESTESLPTTQVTTELITTEFETSVSYKQETTDTTISYTSTYKTPPVESTSDFSSNPTQGSTPITPSFTFPIWLIALLVVLGILALLMTLLCLLRKTCWAQRAVTPDDLRKTLEDDVLKDSISKSPISSIDIDIDYTPDDISINENKFTEQLIAVERKLQEIPQMPPDMEDIPAPAFTREHTLYYV